MLLAAGLGTRLRPLTDELPKALVPVGDRTLLDHAIDKVKSRCTQIAVNAHHHAALVERAANGRVRVSFEDELLGTAGGIARARTRFGLGDVLVYNTDIFADFDLASLELHDAIATLLVVPAQEGNVGIDDDGNVVRLRRASFGKETRGANFVGVHVVSEKLALVDRGCIVGDVYIPALARGEKIRAVYTDAPFIDAGTIEGYLAANMSWLGGRSAFVGEGARVEAPLDSSIVGARAKVGGKGKLLRTIVWPDAIATAPLEDAVVTPARVVHLQQ